MTVKHQQSRLTVIVLKGIEVKLFNKSLIAQAKILTKVRKVDP